MFEDYLFDFIRLPLRDRKSIENAKWEKKYIYSLNYLNSQMKSAQEFVNTVCSMLRESYLITACADGTHRARLAIPYGVDDESEVLGSRTFGYIFKKDFFLDCTMIYDRMCETEQHVDRYKQVFFSRLIRAGVLKPCLHPLQYRWFKQHRDIHLVPEQLDHKFYCVPNNVLNMEIGDFAGIYQDS